MPSYKTYPGVDERYRFPPEVMSALATSSQLTSAFSSPSQVENLVDDRFQGVADAFNVAQSMGFSGTREEWLESLQGAEGKPGPYGGTSVIDPQVAALITSEGATREALLSSLTSNSSQPTGKGEIVVNAIDYGFSSQNGSNDAELNAAIQAGANSGVPVIVPPGNYKMLSSLSIPSGTDLRMHPNTVLDFSESTSIYYLNMAGILSSTKHSITGIAHEGTYELSVPGHDIHDGDWIKVSSDDIFDSANTSIALGEMVQVREVGVDTITLWSPLRDLYETNARVQKATMSEHIRISGGLIQGNGIPSTGKSGLYATYVNDLVVSNTRFKDIDNRHLGINNSVNSWVIGCYFQSAHSSSTGYGVSFGNASRDCGVLRSWFLDVRHSLSTNNNYSGDHAGITRRILFAYNTVENSATATGGSGGDAIDTHGAAEEIDILYNRVNGSSGSGINVECATGRVIGNLVLDPASHGIYVHNETDRRGDYVISNNVIRGIAGQTIYGIRQSSGFRGGSGRVFNLVVSSNLIEYVNVGIQVGRHGGSADSVNDQNLVVSANSVRNCTSYALHVSRASAVACSGNVFYDTAQGVRVVDSDYVTLGPDTIRAVLAEDFIAIRLENVTRSRVQPGAIRSTYKGIYIDPACTSLSVGAYSHVFASIQMDNQGASSVVVGT